MSNMITNAALSNFIHVPQSAEAELVNLTEGHLIRATVQRVQDEMALLNFNGKSLMVRADVPLEPQQRVLLQVTQVGADKVSLQIISQNSPATTNAQSTLSLQPDNLTSLLTSWGLDPDPTNQAIAKAVFAQSQTLTPETIQEVRTLWQTLPALTSLPPETGGKVGNMEALVYLNTNQLPINEESLSLARHWLNNSLPIAQRLTDLQQTMQTVQAQLQTQIASLANQSQSTTSPQQQLLQAITGQPQLASTELQSLNNLLTTINASLSQMTNWSISADTPPDQIISRLATLITNLGTPPESQLANQTATNTTPAMTTPQPELANGGGERGTSPVLTTPTTNNGAESNPQQAQIATTPNSISAPQTQVDVSQLVRPQVDTAGNPLHQLSAVITEALANPNLDKPTTQALQNVLHQLDAITKDLGAIQLSNLTNAPHPALEPYYLFPIPLNTENGPQTAHLKVYRRYGNNEVDPNNLRLALLLDMPALGEIAINLTVFEKNLSAKILSGRETTHQLVETELTDLDQNLSKLGYQVDSLIAELLAVETKSIFEEPEPLEKVEIPMAQINITA